MGFNASGPSLAATNGDSGGIAVTPGQWSIQAQPATATQATVTKAAGGAGVRHICTGISAFVAAGATAQTPIIVNLRDGATGVGTILWSATFAAPANQMGAAYLTDLNIVGSPNTAMTLEFAAAGVAASQETVSLQGYEVSGG